MTVNTIQSPAALSVPGLPTAGKADTPQIPRDNRYRLTQNFVAAMRLELLGSDALRLIHAMLHITCRDNPNWTSGGYTAPEGGYNLLLHNLHATIGPAASNDSRSYHRGIAVLRDSGIFDVIEVLHGGQVLHWVYAPGVLDWLFADEHYGILDIAAIGDLKRPVPIAVYTEICLRRWLPRPTMDLNVEALCATLGPGGTSWDRLRGPFVAALQAIAAREEMRFVVTLEWRFRLAGIDTLGLRVIHKESTWTPKRLGKPVPNLRGALLVTAQDVKRLDASAFTQERVASLLA